MQTTVQHYRRYQYRTDYESREHRSQQPRAIRVCDNRRPNEVKVFTTDATPKLVATIPTGELPHGLWPSGDGSRVYVGLENSDGVAAIDTLTNRVIATIHSGQSPQGVAYVPDAVPSGDGMQNLVSLGASGSAAHLVLADAASRAAKTTVTVNNQGVLDLLEAAVTGLEPGGMYTAGPRDAP